MMLLTMTLETCSRTAKLVVCFVRHETDFSSSLTFVTPLVEYDLQLVQTKVNILYGNSDKTIYWRYIHQNLCTGSAINGWDTTCCLSINSNIVEPFNHCNTTDQLLFLWSQGVTKFWVSHTKKSDLNCF